MHSANHLEQQNHILIITILNELNRNLGRLQVTADSNREMLASHIARLASHVDFRSGHLERHVRVVIGQTTRLEQVHVPALQRQVAALTSKTFSCASPTTPTTTSTAPQPTPSALIRQAAGKLGRDFFKWLLARSFGVLVRYLLPALLTTWGVTKAVAGRVEWLIGLFF